jgi:nicotinate dehydrogenase subunit A
MIEITLNGRAVQIESDPVTPLLYVLRDELKMNGAKFGCGLGQCGACTVLIDGKPAFSCVTPVAALAEREVTTLEGLGTLEQPGRMQQAFIEEQAAQCGYCIPGMIMRAQALLARGTAVSDDDIREHMTPNLCRCGTHARILRAIRRALGTVETAEAGNLKPGAVP